MGKGEIISDLGDGAYNVRIIYAGRDRVAQEITAINEKLSYLASEIANLQKQVEELLLTLEPVFDPTKTDPDSESTKIEEDSRKTDPDVESEEPFKYDKGDPQPDDQGDPQPDDQGDPQPIDESDPDPLTGDSTISGLVTDI